MPSLMGASDTFRPRVCVGREVNVKPRGASVPYSYVQAGGFPASRKPTRPCPQNRTNVMGKWNAEFESCTGPRKSVDLGKHL